MLVFVVVGVWVCVANCCHSIGVLFVWAQGMSSRTRTTTRAGHLARMSSTRLLAMVTITSSTHAEPKCAKQLWTDLALHRIGSHGMCYCDSRYYVTIGHNNDNEYDSHDQYRIFRAPASPGLSLAYPMDLTYNIQVGKRSSFFIFAPPYSQVYQPTSQSRAVPFVFLFAWAHMQVWSGEYWVPVQYQCNPADCGPCWQPVRNHVIAIASCHWFCCLPCGFFSELECPSACCCYQGRENLCCEGDMTSTDDCNLASLDQEGPSTVVAPTHKYTKTLSILKNAGAHVVIRDSELQDNGRIPTPTSTSAATCQTTIKISLCCKCMLMSLLQRWCILFPNHMRRQDGGCCL